MTGQQTRVNGSSTMEMGNSNQELLSGGKKGRLTIVIIGLIIVIALGFLVVFILNNSNAEPNNTSPLTSNIHSIDLVQMLTGTYTPNRFNGTWVSDVEILYRDSFGGIILYNVQRNSKKTLVTNLSDVIPGSFSYELSADKRFLLIGHTYQKLYRHSFLAYYAVINIKTLVVTPISDAQGAPRQIQLAIWSPVGNALAYVFMNDIYYIASVEQPVQEVRLTRNGRTHTILNGVADWVYEEEVFSSNKAMWFSPNGKRLAFATFNDTTTPVMSIPYYGNPGNFAFQYTQMVNIRYPKPGRPNPEVRLTVANLESPSQQIGSSAHLLNIPAPIKEAILSSVTWATDSDLVAVWMNRIQNEAQILICSDSEECKIVMEFEEKKGWVDFFTPPVFSSDGHRMIFIYSSEQRDGSGKFRHLISVDLTTNTNKVVPLTYGKFTVTDLLSWDEQSHEVYFLSNTENSTSHLRISKVSDVVHNAPYYPECVSCKILTLDREKCLYSGATFSTKSSYLALTCAGPNVPEIRIFEKSGKEVLVWETNEELKTLLREVTLPISKEVTVPIADGFEAIVELQLPPNYDSSGKTKYPALVQVYGGPDTNLISKRFSIDWDTYLTVNQSIIYINIDARNSGLRGDALRFAGYRKLGTVEVEDVLYVTRYLQDNFNFIDKNRTAIWGWSYGGYATVMALAKDSANVFKCGISVAPVTDWIYYDSIYTERFMGLPTPEDNLVGYMNASIFNKIDTLKNKDFFLVHGTLDDNVHYQQSMMLAKMLEQHDILFRQQNYPDEEHGLNGVRTHLYHSLGQFLSECFLLK